MKNSRQEPLYDPGMELVEVLKRTQEDRVLLGQILRLAKLSLDLRQRGYTGRVELNLANGLVNSVRQEEWADWRDRPPL